MSIKVAPKPISAYKFTPVQKPVLTEKEDELFTLLDEFCKHRADAGHAVVECRVAGGWVRDKLIGIQSDDIDIALSSMTGAVFAQEFVPYLCSKGVHAKNAYTVRQNPEQSKHLETSTADILGAKIDFVNLRSEEYAADSRIPTSVSFGTPLEDALRRDINFNAMFYNVHTREVEDPLRKGFADLRSGLVRTPLDPILTFQDDPLRILRCMRFASRLGMKVNSDIFFAARDPGIQLALSQKVAKERVGTELTKMLTGNDPMYSIMLLSECSLLECILTPPRELPYSSPDSIASSMTSSLVLNNILRGDGVYSGVHNTLVQLVQDNRDVRGRLFLACLLTPWKDRGYQRKSRSTSAAEYIIDNAMKLGRQHHFLDGIPRLFASLNKVKGFFAEHQDSKPVRVRFGQVLRDYAIHDSRVGLDWRLSLLFSLIQDLVELCPEGIDDASSPATCRRITEYNQLVEQIEALDLPSVLELKPLITGNEVRESLKIKAKGAWIGQILERVMEWQLGHPLGTREELVEWMRDGVAKGELNVPPAEDGRPNDDGPEQKRARVEVPTEVRP